MKVNELIGSMAFSHRPQDGISLGVAVANGTAFLSVGFVREGDYFNRKLARHILTQRVVSTLEGNPHVKFTSQVFNLPGSVDARSIIRELRKAFKPDPACNDETFSFVSNIGTVQIREPMDRDHQWLKIRKMFAEATGAAASCVS